MFLAVKQTKRQRERQTENLLAKEVINYLPVLEYSYSTQTAANFTQFSVAVSKQCVTGASVWATTS